MFLIVLVALQPKITLWGLIELKMQIMVQVAPLFILGVHSKRVTSKGMLAGLIIGFLFSIITFFMGYKTLGGIQSGLIALLLNLIACFVFSCFLPNKLNAAHEN